MLSDSADATTVLISIAPVDSQDCSTSQQVEGLALQDENAPNSSVASRNIEVARRALRNDRANRTRKIKVKEVKNETQTSKYIAP